MEAYWIGYPGFDYDDELGVPYIRNKILKKADLYPL